MSAISVKAMVCNAWGGPDSLSLADLPLPALGPKDVRIKVHAAGLNFPDTLMIAGKYQVKPAFPFAPGMECAGVIEAVGDKVEDLAPGDQGIAESALRPSGRARFEKRFVDVITDGEFISKGSKIRVVETLGSRVLVSQINE